MHKGFYWENLRERDHLENPGIDGRIILQWIFKTLGGWACTGFVWLRIGAGSGYFECCNEPSGSINVGNLLTS